LFESKAISPANKTEGIMNSAYWRLLLRSSLVLPILCLTSSRETARRLALVWGTHCVETSDVSSFSEMVDKACRIALEEKFAEVGQRLVVTAGVPFGTPGSTNVLRIAWVTD